MCVIWSHYRGQALLPPGYLHRAVHRSKWRLVTNQKKPRVQMRGGAKIWLVAANQRSSVEQVDQLLATVSGFQPPPRAL